MSADSLKKIDREIAKYPPDQKQSAVMSALIIAQDEKGWLSTEVMDFVAELPRHGAGRGLRGGELLHDVQPASRPASTSSRICTCLPCGLQGSLAAADHLRGKLGIDFNETTPDGRFTLKEGECMGACAMAPVVLVNNKKMHDYMSNEKLDQLPAGAQVTMLDYGPDAILMKGLDGAQLAPQGLRGARRLRGA